MMLHIKVWGVYAKKETGSICFSSAEGVWEKLPDSRLRINSYVFAFKSWMHYLYGS